MGRILAIDYGRKRTGLAVSDTLRIIANAIGTISTGTIWKFIEDYLNKEKVDIIVVGYPKQMNNMPSESVEYIMPFFRKLKQKYPLIEVTLYDERFTSKMAFQTMIDAGVKKKDRKDKSLIDKISATIILQSYMESLKLKQR